MTQSGEPFDPYYHWLGIPPDEQPPNHYRLLGIKSLEENREVIQNAADRQMVHLRTFQAGPRAALSQKLLNEVSAARVCLLSAEKKNAYDQQLREAAADAFCGDAVCADSAGPSPARPVGSGSRFLCDQRRRALRAGHGGRPGFRSAVRPNRGLLAGRQVVRPRAAGTPLPPARHSRDCRGVRIHRFDHRDRGGNLAAIGR